LIFPFYLFFFLEVSFWIVNETLQFPTIFYPLGFLAVQKIFFRNQGRKSPKLKKNAGQNKRLGSTSNALTGLLGPLSAKSDWDKKTNINRFCSIDKK
jgi:hypothetical protein